MSLPAIHSRARIPAWCVLVALLCDVATGRAQRVEFPTPIPGATPYGGSSVYPPTPAGTPVYPTTPAPTSVYPPMPQPSIPSYSTPAAAPTFDPYANPSLGAPPVDVPYSAPGVASPYTVAPTQPTFGTPFPTTPAPSTGSTLFQNSTTPQWSNSATYSHQNPDGTVARLQRLMQQLSFEQTYLFGDHDARDLEINRTEFSATFGVPIFYNPNTPLLITPGFAFNWLEGPVDAQADLPPRVYDAYLDTAWYPRFSPIIGADLGVRTGVWTDFEAVNSDSIRILGRGLGVISISPRMDVLAGVWYLDRNHIKLLPAGGIHWKPGPEWDAYLVFPNPKVRKRFVNVGASQWWWYVAGEYGGGRWTIERDPAHFVGDDDIDINDLRVFGGFEWETQTQARGHVEAGYVFDREIRYDSGVPAKFDLDDTWMVRVGVDF